MDIYKKRIIVQAIMDGKTSLKDLTSVPGITASDIMHASDVIHDEDRVLVWENCWSRKLLTG